MLQAIRDRVTGIIAGVILGLLAIPFALVGIQNYFTPDLGNVVARVGDEEISAAEFQQSFSQQRQRAQQVLGASFNPGLFEGIVPRREHLELMINERLLQQFAAKGGMVVPPRELAESIASIPNFQVGGQFDSELYRRLLANQGYTPSRFEDTQRLSLRMTDLLTALNGSAFATSEEANQILKLQDEKRHIQFYPLNAASFREQISLSDDELRAYYDEHASSFMTEEQVIIDYIEVNASDYQSTVSISDDTLLARYENEKGRFVSPERRLTSHILLNTDSDESADAALSQAAELAKRAREGEDFTVLAKEFSQDPGSSESGGDLGWVERGVMVKPFEDALFAMQEGEFSEPVKTEYGYHIIWLRELDESHGQSFEEVKEELRQEESEQQSRQVYDDLVSRLTNITYEDTGSLALAAEETGLEIKTSPAFGRSGGPGIASFPEVPTTAFSDLVLRDEINSDPIQVEPDHTVVLRINQHLPSTQRPFEDVSEEIRAILLQERSSAAAKTAAESDLMQIMSGEQTLDTAAASHEEQVTTMEQMSRRDFQLGLPFIQAVFALAAPGEQATYHVVPRNAQDWALVALHNVIEGDATAAQEASRLQTEREIAAYYSRAEQEHLIALMRANTKIEVYEDRLQ